MRFHDHNFPERGKAVILGDGAKDSLHNVVVPGATFWPRDWWDVIRNTSWRNETTDSLALAYALRRSFEGLPDDEEVLLGEILGVSVAVHYSELSIAGTPALVGV
jgi:hypothetical protein